MASAELRSLRALVPGPAKVSVLRFLLFDRLPRGVRLTAAGLRSLQTRVLVEALHEASSSVVARSVRLQARSCRTPTRLTSAVFSPS